jgi:hypothetical protein
MIACWLAFQCRNRRVSLFVYKYTTFEKNCQNISIPALSPPHDLALKNHLRLHTNRGRSFQYPQNTNQLRVRKCLFILMMQ